MSALSIHALKPRFQALLRPLGKSDRAFVFGALGLWVGLGAPLPAWTAWLMPAMAALLLVTIVNRLRRGIAERRARQP